MGWRTLELRSKTRSRRIYGFKSSPPKGHSICEYSVDATPRLMARKEPHMNCCNDYGQCTQGPGCPARTTKLIVKANERIRQLEAEKLALSNPGYPYAFLDAPEPPKAPPMHIRMLDWVGNLWDAAKTGFYDAISLGLYLWRIVAKAALLGILALLLVFACALVAPLVIPGVMR